MGFFAITHNILEIFHVTVHNSWKYVLLSDSWLQKEGQELVFHQGEIKIG